MAGKFNSVKSLFNGINSNGAKSVQDAIAQIDAAEQRMLGSTSLKLSHINGNSGADSEIDKIIKESTQMAIQENIEKVRNSIENIFMEFSFSPEREREIVEALADTLKLRKDTYEETYEAFDKYIHDHPLESDLISSYIKAID